MIDIAIEFLGSYLARKGGNLVDRAGADADSAIDRKLGELYEFMKSRLTGLGRRGERSLRALEQRPGAHVERTDAAEDLVEALSHDAAGRAQLQALVEELTAMDPAGVRLRGAAHSGTVDLDADSIGVDVAGRLHPGDAADGVATAAMVKGRQVGVNYRPGPP